MTGRRSLLEEIHAAGPPRGRTVCEIRDLIAYYHKMGRRQDAEDLVTALLDRTIAGSAIERALNNRDDLKMPAQPDHLGRRVSEHRRNRCACRRLDK